VAVEPMLYNLELLQASINLNDDIHSYSGGAVNMGAGMGGSPDLPFRERVQLFHGAVADENSKGVKRCVEPVGAADNPLVEGGISNRGNGQLAVKAEPEDIGSRACREVVQTTTIDELLGLDGEEGTGGGGMGGGDQGGGGLLHRFPGIFMVKLDIEGWETLALKGATKLLAGGRGHSSPCLIFLEHYKNFAVRTGVGATEVFEMLVANFGYKVSGLQMQ
jgi:hypothetical protein